MLDFLNNEGKIRLYILEKFVILENLP
jgi:hypothetical protein